MTNRILSSQCSKLQVLNNRAGGEDYKTVTQNLDSIKWGSRFVKPLGIDLSNILNTFEDICPNTSDTYIGGNSLSAWIQLLPNNCE